MRPEPSIRTPRARPRRDGPASGALAVTLATLPVASGLSGCVPEGPPSERDPALGAGFRDDFEREQLGEAYRATSAAWQIEGGALCGRGAKNHGVWLTRRLPRDARITFDAWTTSTDGDLKVELWGDGKSHATGNSYDDATGYLAILGGWSNRRHVLARLDEHGDDRVVMEVEPSATTGPAAPVFAGRRYRFVIERDRDERLRWSVDGELVASFDDPEPLAGPGHDHFGFNDWATPVCFDDLEVLPL
ncbi:MAG: hypothetical protein KC731_04300 [Myxococcales bacterium]|nr:hypothetical protein [Myxococcales bacterium]